MNVLIVTLHYLDGVGGAVFASRAYINALTEIFAPEGKVSLIFPSSPSHPAEGIDPRVELMPVEDVRHRLLKGLDLLRGRVHRNFKVLPEILGSRRFDLVVFDNSRVSFRMIDRARRSGAKVATIHHNCELEYNRDNSVGMMRPVILHWTRRYESEAWAKSDLNLMITPEDLEIFKASYAQIPPEGARVLGVFESTDKAMVPVTKKASAENGIKEFIITGNLSSRQTIDSLLPWLDGYFPILREEFPQLHLVVAGKDPAAELTARCGQLGIEVIPSPARMEPLIEKADCYICPTALGGGLKLRIMDGLKAGLPVLTHAVSARGYGEFAEKGFLFPYTDKDSFRKMCVILKARRFSPQQIIDEYHRLFSFRAGIERLKSSISSI